MIRLATTDDWAAFTGKADPPEWHGYVDASEWLIEGLGAVFKGDGGKWWITFVRAPGVRKTKTAHAMAKRLLKEAKDKGFWPVHGLADPRITGAEKWMQRLGFVPTDDEQWGLPVWVLK